MKTILGAAILAAAILIAMAACASAPTATPVPTSAPTATSAPKPTDTSAPIATYAPIPLQVRQIDTRAGVTLRFVLSVPDNPKAVLIIFTGGDGTNPFRVSGNTVSLTGNFVVRTTPDFVQKGFAAAVVENPSDHISGILPSFRTSPEHAQDISKLIDYLDSQGLKSVYIIGTSVGTISPAYLGTVLHDPRIKGLVLAETTTGSGPQTRTGFAWSNMSLANITVPVLMTQNRNDECVDAQFVPAAQLAQRMTGSPKVDFIEVTLVGSPPQSGPCDPFSPHGYFGIEAPVVQAISDWISGKPAPAKIGP